AIERGARGILVKRGRVGAAEIPRRRSLRVQDRLGAAGNPRAGAEPFEYPALPVERGVAIHADRLRAIAHAGQLLRQTPVHGSDHDADARALADLARVARDE